uniref:Uncharacterized protein n=1 Tax=Setaria viridis TaxID=4556 RepID=A0A4U6TAT3_SETVI|nr:hypothetical protein SEVIR_8G017625v2 [Setaria viridis]
MHDKSLILLLSWLCAAWVATPDQLPTCVCFPRHLSPCLLPPTSNFDTMQKEDSSSHQTCGTCMEY